MSRGLGSSPTLADLLGTPIRQGQRRQMFPVLRRPGYETNRNLGQSTSALSLVEESGRGVEEPGPKPPPRNHEEYVAALQEAFAMTEEQKRKIVSNLVDENGETPEDMQCLVCRQTAYNPMVCQVSCTAIICQFCYQQQPSFSRKCP